MTYLRKLAGVIALAAIIAFTLAACDENTDDGSDDPGTKDPDTQQPGTYSGRIAYSSDGINWTAVKGVNFPNHVRNVAFGGGKWVAADYSDGKIASSTDGINWSITADNVLNGEGINGIAYGNGTWVVVGGNRLLTSKNGKARIAYSADAVTWTEAEDTTFGTDNSVLSVDFGDGRFIAHGWSKMAYSTDGINWTSGTSAGNSIESIVWGNDTWVAPRTWDTIYYSANNGSSWTSTRESISTTSGTAIRGIAWGGPAESRKFVAVGAVTATSGSITLQGYYDGKIAYSPDGKTWTKTADTPFSRSTGNAGAVILSVAWGGDKFVAGGVKGEMAYSSDGVTWTIVPNSTFGEKGTINGIACAGGKFVAVGMGIN